jgi:hypothetical protein
MWGPLPTQVSRERPVSYQAPNTEKRTLILVGYFGT